jgi:hypothetical protein
MVALPIACATALPMPNDEMVSQAGTQWPGTSLSDLQMGRSQYVEHCAACHNLHLPSEYSPKRWEEIMVRMQLKAKIDDPLKDSILRYLYIASVESEIHP